MEIYSPKSKSKELFKQNRLYSEIKKEEILEEFVSPKPVFNYQTVEPIRENFLVQKARILKERLMIILEINETV